MLVGFTGILYLDGKHAAKEDASLLVRKMTLPQGAQTSVDSCGALAVAAAVSNEYAYPGIEPILSNKENIILVGAGSVYNKEELVILLNCNIDCTDLELMWHAWLQWGNEMTSHLDGDWMLAVYDSRRDELLLARSWGYSSLYYCQGNNYIAFGTQSAALAKLPGIPYEPNIEAITQMLCILPTDSSASCWKDIYQVQPASRLEISHGKMKEYTWWRPSNVTQKPIKDEREMLDTFVDLYTKAVRKRLRTSMEIGTTLSAGLDSSSVAVLAARELHASGKVLHAWTAASHYPDEAYSIGRWLTDERVLASKAAASFENIHHTVVEASESDPIDAIRKQILRTGKPQSSVANQYWIDHILKLAASANCGVLLLGQFGNSTVSYTPYHVPLFPKGTYFPETTMKNYLRLLKLRMLKNMRQIRRELGDLRFGRQINYPTMNQNYMQSEVFKRIVKTSVTTKKINHASMMEVHRGSFDLWYHNGFWSGVEVRDPTMDMELTEFLLSLPDNIFFRDGIDRRVLRLGMEGILPDEVRLNRRRGQQASDIVPRVRHFHQSAVHALEIINTSMLAKEILNIDRMHQILERIKQGETSLEIFKECSRILLPGISVGLFLASIDNVFDLETPLG